MKCLLCCAVICYFKVPLTSPKTEFFCEAAHSLCSLWKCQLCCSVAIYCLSAAVSECNRQRNALIPSLYKLHVYIFNNSHYR